MLKRPITYTDFDGNEITEDFYFNLSASDIVNLDAKYEGGLEGAIKRIAAAEDKTAMIMEMEKVILASYGERSEDGKRFRKSDELSSDFRYHAAYDVLFFEIISDENKMVEFITQVIPKALLEKLPKETNGVDLVAKHMPTEKPEFKLPQPPLPPSA